MKYYSESLDRIFNSEDELVAAETKAAEKARAQEEALRKQKEEADKRMKQEEEDANVLLAEIRTVLEHIDAYNKKYECGDMGDLLSLIANLF